MIEHKRLVVSEADVLAAVEPAGHDGSPTCVIRNRLWRRDFVLNVTDVRKMLDRLERQGRVHRTRFSRANQVHWKAGPSAQPVSSPPSRGGTGAFKVVRLSEGQMQDVRAEDVLAGGWFRLCETYRGGGGYDLFPAIARSRLGYAHHRQFVVQLLGCHLDCPYCYVTREGVWGEHRRFTAQEIVEAFTEAFEAHGTTVLHLMGGAPALSMKHWPALLDAFDSSATAGCAFHSDLLLTEGIYDVETLRAISRSNCLYAVDVKGLTQEEHQRNTRKPFAEELFWENLDKVERANVPYYLTFTAVENQEPFWERFKRLYPAAYPVRASEAFSIDLIEYAALPFVDRVPWGGRSPASATDARRAETGTGSVHEGAVGAAETPPPPPLPCRWRIEMDNDWKEDFDISKMVRECINSDPKLTSLLYDLDLLPEQLLSQDEKTPGLIKAYHRFYGIMYAYFAFVHQAPASGDEAPALPRERRE